MKAFQDKVAVITGAASGIGRAAAERCAQEGMKIVLADVEAATLAQTEADLRVTGAPVLALPTDVSQAGDMEALAQKTLDAFGAVHLLFNNAGVGAGGSIWETSLAEWEWVLGVNLWGVIHGLRFFVPIMLAQDTEGHIVNSASLAGLLPYHPSAPYQVTKQGIVALSEQLHYSLKQRRAKIKVSVLCPGVVKTQIMDAARNRPFEQPDETAVEETSPQQDLLIQRMQSATDKGMPPAQVVERVFQAIRDEEFYILTHPEFNRAIQTRTEHVVQGLAPPDLYQVIGYLLKAHQSQRK